MNVNQLSLSRRRFLQGSLALGAGGAFAQGSPAFRGEIKLGHGQVGAIAAGCRTRAGVRLRRHRRPHARCAVPCMRLP
ncbi:twin-arginine translocation signal domain-containing protein [Variovorax paradoxus]|nr:twin-arginine translocation signal domain-containing protein [Variovorax paradoxus]